MSNIGRVYLVASERLTLRFVEVQWISYWWYNPDFPMTSCTMESTNLSKSNYFSSYDSKVARLGQGVDIKFSQGSGTSTERVKITIVLH